METEYGLSVIPGDPDEPYDSEHAAGQLIHLARALPHLPAKRSSGLFLANGARFYIDCGAHPELATPECANPWDVCRYLQAGDRMMLDLAEKLTRHEPTIAQTLILKGNVDYTARTTWASHESYQHRPLMQSLLARHIVPHLASRVVITGAGGFDCFSPGIDFMISPRVAHLRHAISSDSTSGRGIFHTKDEPLAGHGSHRLHVLSGESLCSETGSWLKVATTALVVALIEAGKAPAESVQFADPVAAMRTFATDPACRRAVRLSDGREVTALDVQRELLRQAEAHTDADFMPPWTGEVCRQWRAMLERLARGPAAVAKTLDWAIKLALFQNHARRRGTTLETLARWTPVLTDLNAALEALDGAWEPLSAKAVLGRTSPIADARERLTPKLHEAGLGWDGLEAMLALRLELFEIDTRFSLLGTSGVFASLERAGVLEHHFAGVDNFPHALAHPPAIGRAAIRGQVIRRVTGQNGRFRAEWDGVWDLEAGCQLDLSDPFCTAERWTKTKPPAKPPVDLEALFRDGAYADVLENARHEPTSFSGIETMVLSHARLGRRQEALELLEAFSRFMDEFHRIALSMSILSNGLVPAVAQTAPLVARGDAFMEYPEALDEYSRLVFLSYKALHLMHRGDHAQAEAGFQSLLADPSFTMRPRMSSRTRCYLAELYRLQGRRAEALDLAHTAATTHRAENLRGDSAAHSLPLLARLTRERDEATHHLDRAQSILTLQRNPLALAHVLCLRARRLPDSTPREEFARLHRTVPALTDCPVARRIAGEWDTWIAPPAGVEPVDYWGL
jgi:tetratricopeptide (TPR) repeat protein